MEKKTPIKQSQVLPSTGFYIELNCPYCGKEETIIGDTRKEVVDNTKYAGWKNLTSDIYDQSGHYCGCNYLIS